MAAKTHVDSSVGERRLRPIYEWLDNGNNKKALQEAEKVLKKQPNFLCAKVLKALALLRLGKEDECEQLLEAVRAEVPADDSTLQAMTICYREVHRREKICEIYEAAVRKEPSSEELLTHLFMAYVRVADYKKQQQTALQLYRLKPKNPYYFWAVMSVVMQAHKAEPPLAQGVVLPLAERMVQKLVQEDRIEAEQEVQLYLMVLEMQSKYEEALRVVEGPLGEKLISYVVVPVKRASLLMKLERWREANVLFKQLLQEDMDRWSHLTNYLTTSLKLFDSGQQNGNNNTLNNSSPTNTNNINNNQDSTNKEASDGSEILWQEADTTPVACCRFLENLVKAADKETRRLRGPYLAQLELYRMLSEHGIDPRPLLGSPVDLLMRYVKYFAEKPCCVPDLRRFLPLLTSTDRGLFLQRVAEVTTQDPSSSATALQKHVCGLQLARMLGAHLELTEPQRQGLATELQRFYRESADICPENLQTEFACNDPYALLAAHVLFDSWLATGRSAPLVRAAQALELALARSPANFHVKLLLLRTYTALGAGAAADAVYELLDVKHMQLDSLGYLHCAQLAQLGQLRAAAALYEITLKFFNANYKDGVDHLTYSYKFGSFLKILEFVEFCERLNNSLHHALTKVERLLLEVVECPSAAAVQVALSAMNVQHWKDTIAWNSLQDNRDTSILSGWEPPCREVTQEHLRQSFEDDMTLLRIRSLLLRVVATAANLPSSSSAPAPSSVSEGSGRGTLVNGGEVVPPNHPDAEGQPAPLGLLGQLTEELSAAVEAAAVTCPAPAPAPPCMPPPSRLHALVAGGTLPPLVDTATALVSCATGRGRPDAERRAAAAADGAAATVARAAARARAQARAATGPEPSLPDALADRRDTLALAIAATEMLALAALLVGAGRTALRPSVATGNASRRARRRKPQEAASSSTSVVSTDAAGARAEGDWPLGCVSGLAGTLHAAALTLDAALADWEAAAESAEAEAEGDVASSPQVGGGPEGASEVVSARLAALSLAGPGEAPTPGPPPSTAALVRARLADSLRASLREMRRVLQCKVQYLATLKHV